MLPVPTASDQPSLVPVSIPPKKEKSRLFKLFIFFSFLLLFVVIVGVILVFALRCTTYWPGFSACKGKLLHSGVEMLATRDAYFVKSPLRQDVPCEEDMTDGREYARCAVAPAQKNATTTIDAASFSFLSNSFSDTEWYAKDKNNAYYLNLNNCRDSICVSTFHIIEGVDPASFRIETPTVSGAYGAADKNNLYSHGCKLYGVVDTGSAVSLRENPNSYSVRRLEYESNYRGQTAEWPCAYYGWKQFSDKEAGITLLYPDWLASEEPEVTRDGKTWINFSAEYTPSGGFGIIRTLASQQESTSDFPIYDACLRGQPYLAASFEKETPKLNVTKATLENRVAERLKQYLGGTLAVDLLALRLGETCYVVRVFDQEFIKDELSIERIFNSVFTGSSSQTANSPLVTFTTPKQGDQLNTDAPTLVKWNITNSVLQKKFVDFKFQITLINSKGEFAGAMGDDGAFSIGGSGSYSWNIAHYIQGSFYNTLQPNEKYRIRARLFYAGNVPFTCDPKYAGSPRTKGECVPLYPEPIQSLIKESAQYVSDSDPFTIKVSQETLTVSCSITFDRSAAKVGEKVRLSWTSKNANWTNLTGYGTENQNLGATNGVIDISYTTAGQYPYSLTVHSQNGAGVELGKKDETATCSTTVNITP